MTRLARIAAISAGAGLLVFGASGCSHNTAALGCLAPGKSLALAIGARSNSPAQSLSADLTTLINSAISAQQKITIVRLDGDPHIVFSQALSLQGNSQAHKSESNQYIGSLNAIMSGTGVPATDIRAQVPQANVLEALAVAAGSVPPGGDVVLMDSGLQTTDPLNFATGLLGDDPQTIVDYLRHAHELPNLRGRRVYFVGLGWTASPQPALNISNRAQVVKIWTSIAHAAGARCIGVDQTPNTASAVSGRPPVAIVTPPPPPNPPSPCKTYNLNDANHVGFDFASTKFRQPDPARATLRKLANVIIGSHQSVTLTGSTSSEGSDSYNKTLSLQRANAVKTVLVQLGVPASRIKTFGDGSHLPGRVNDRGPNGQLLIGPAIQDRKVVAKLTGARCPST